MVTGIKKVTFYNPTTGDAVQINNVSPESAMKIKEPFSTEAADGSLVYAGEESALEIKAFEELPAQLETWMEEETELNAVVYGIDAHVLWYENAPITVVKNIGSAPGERNGFTVKMERKGGEHDIQAGNNLLYLARGWKDDDADAVADGYTLDFNVAPAATAFADNIQKITGAAEAVSLFTSLVFPIAGAVLRLFNNISYPAWQENGALKIIQTAYDGTVLATDTLSDVKDVLEITTASGVYKLEAHIISDADIASGEEIRFEDPYLGTRTEGKIRY